VQGPIDAVGGDHRDVHQHPKAIMSAAMEIWCKGMCSNCMVIRVIPTVSGKAVATPAAERQSIRKSAMIMTMMTASTKERMKWWMR